MLGTYNIHKSDLLTMSAQISHACKKGRRVFRTEKPYVLKILERQDRVVFPIKLKLLTPGIFRKQIVTMMTV